MIKDEVKHIFNRSACLTKKQFETYLAGNMITEEIYGVEHHINGCPLCSIAMDGMQMRKDALDVVNSLNSDFLKEKLEEMEEPVPSGASAYMKNLNPKNLDAKPLMNVVKVGVAIAACAGILWFVQSVGKDNKASEQVAQTEEVVNEEPREEVQSVVVEEPLVAETQESTDPPQETMLIEEAPETPPPAEQKPVAVTPAKNEEIKKEVSSKPVTPVTANKSTANPPANKGPEKTPIPNSKQQPVTATAKAKPEPAKNEKPVPPQPPKQVAREEPKPQPVQKEEPKPQPVVKDEAKPEPKPAAKKEEPAEELPSDPLAAGKALMDRKNYNAAINKMRNEMRSNDKGRRQEAVMMVAKCYNAIGNKDRAKELLNTLVDEGGPEKKNAKKMLKELDKNAKDD